MSALRSIDRVPGGIPRFLVERGTAGGIVHPNMASTAELPARSPSASSSSGRMSLAVLRLRRGRYRSQAGIRRRGSDRAQPANPTAPHIRSSPSASKWASIVHEGRRDARRGQNRLHVPAEVRSFQFRWHGSIKRRGVRGKLSRRKRARPVSKSIFVAVRTPRRCSWASRRSAVRNELEM